MVFKIIYSLNGEKMEEECCNIERVRNALKSLGKQQLEIIINEDKKAELECPYCKKKYNFSEEELIRILAEI